ncbi:hypothetical protein I4U23_000321 [Adineta vaga]|nr:hypothetical protein I4U23_000321 [Adineta vaga]
MSISIFERSPPDEIILNICQYLSWMDIMIAFYNLNSRFNRTVSSYLKHVCIGNDCELKQFQSVCSLLLSHRSFLLDHIQTLANSVIENADKKKFQYLVTLYIYDSQYTSNFIVHSFRGNHNQSNADR